MARYAGSLLVFAAVALLLPELLFEPAETLGSAGFAAELTEVPALLLLVVVVAGSGTGLGAADAGAGVLATIAGNDGALGATLTGAGAGAGALAGVDAAATAAVANTEAQVNNAADSNILFMVIPIKI